MHVKVLARGSHFDWPYALRFAFEFGDLKTKCQAKMGVAVRRESATGVASCDEATFKKGQIHVVRRVVRAAREHLAMQSPEAKTKR